MNNILQPWQLLFAILSGWVHRRQQEIIEFQEISDCQPTKDGDLTRMFTLANCLVSKPRYLLTSG